MRAVFVCTKFQTIVRQMRYALILLLFSTMAPSLAGQNAFVGEYNGQYNSDPVQMTLKSAGGAALTGELNDGSNVYAVTATAAGNTLTGKAVEPSLNLTFALKGVLAGAQLTLDLTFSLLGQTNTQSIVLTKKGAASAPAAPSAPTTAAPGKRDRAVVGTWTKETHTNSGSGSNSAYATTVQGLTFKADGTLRDEGARTVTGGSNFSGDTGTSAAKDVPGTTWYTENQNIYLTVTENGKTQTVKLGRYFIENGKMLITGDNGKKELFYKK